MKKFTCFMASLAVLAVAIAGCAGAGSEGETETRQFGSIPMSNAPIYQADGVTTVATTLAGTLHILPIEQHTTEDILYPVAGSVSGGKITVTLPDMAGHDQLWDSSTHDRITTDPAGTKIFPGALFALVDSYGVSQGQLVYGKVGPDLATVAGFLYCDDGPVDITPDTFDITAAQSGWNVVTYEVEGDELAYSDSIPLPGDAVWLYVTGEN